MNARDGATRETNDHQGIVINSDTSVDDYFGPKAPAGPSTGLWAGQECNWVKTVPGRLERHPAPLWTAPAVVRPFGRLRAGSFNRLRVDKTSRPGGIEPMK